jgi:hypothetical protein
MLDRQPGDAGGKAAVASALNAQGVASIYSARIHSLLALEAGGILCLMWDSARNTISHSFGIIYDHAGSIVNVITGDIDKDTRAAWDARRRVIICASSSSLSLRDVRGQVIRQIVLSPASSNVLKGYELAGIDRAGRLLFLSSDGKQTNSFVLLPPPAVEPEGGGDCYEADLAEHKRRVAAAKKAQASPDFRWTAALPPA